MRSPGSILNGVRRHNRTFSSLILIVAALLFMDRSGTVYPKAISSATAGCTTSKPSSGAYSVTVCITSPASGATLTSNATASATVSTTGSAVQRVLFYLDGAYLLTDYSSSYTFVMQTNKWPDGVHTLSASATMRDGFVSARAYRSFTFSNGVTAVPTSTANYTITTGRAGTPFIVAATGDGASGEPNAGKVANEIKAANPNLFLYLGDVYERGTPTEFFNWYGNAGSYFSALRSITAPTVGNHEYLTSGAKGYFDYWNSLPKYYSFNAHGWHFISLNSNSSYTPTTSGSAQYNWLKNELASLPAGVCTIVIYHHPYFNIGPEGAATGMSAVWSLMAQYGVDIVLNGHDHDYQRWKPLNASGVVSSNGITEFVVGSGGHGLQTFTRSDARVAYKNDSNPTAFGALFLTLNSTSASFTYKNIGGTVLDSGTVPCVSPTSATSPTSTASASSATATPTAQTMTFKPVADAYVDATYPSTNFGTLSMLRTDASPDQHSYLRFSVSGLGGQHISKVRLLLYANTSTIYSVTASGVGSTTWGETTLTYGNAPALGAGIASASSVPSGTWVSFDVTSYVKGEGTYSFAVTTSGSTSLNLASRESGANSPKLIVTLGP